MIQLTNEPIDTEPLQQAVRSPLAGAVVMFLGTTRQRTAGRETTSLDYECHQSMAEKQLAAILKEADDKWPLIGRGVIHRLGHVAVGEASIAVAVSSVHRVNAFEAASWVMDEIKQRVPIWKRENWADGTTEWVHPGLDSTDAVAPAIEERSEHTS